MGKVKPMQKIEVATMGKLVTSIRECVNKLLALGIERNEIVILMPIDQKQRFARYVLENLKNNKVEVNNHKANRISIESIDIAFLSPTFNTYVFYAHFSTSALKGLRYSINSEVLFY